MLKRTLFIMDLSQFSFIGSKVYSAKLCGAAFPRSVDDVTKLVNSAKQQTETALQKIYSIQKADRTFDNTVKMADHAQANLSTATALLEVCKYTAPEAALRDSASEATVKLEEIAIDSFGSNKKLYEAFRDTPEESAVTNQSQKKRTAEEVSAERCYWLSERMKEFKRKGLELPDEEFKKVTELQKQLAALTTEFEKNIAEDSSTIQVALRDLKGVPAPIVEACQRATFKKNAAAAKKETAAGEEGKETKEEKEPEPDAATIAAVDPVTLRMDYPTYFGVMKNCEVASTRQAMNKAFENRAFPKNLEVLHKVVATRAKLASALSFNSYAHYDLSDKMAESPEVAKAFVQKLIPPLAKKWEMESNMLKKAGLHESVVLAEGDKFHSYDLPFVMDQYKRKHLNVDEPGIQNYFAMDTTLAALFDIYERFFGIEFVCDKEKDRAEKHFWHEDAYALAVYRRNPATQARGQLLGHIALDLFPREGKYTHACCCGVLPPVRKQQTGNDDVDDDGFEPAVAVLLCNFPPPSPTRPALFLHGDVETFFHEFGHAIHFLMGRTEMATVAGYNVKMDFVELPSQMLEEWMWEPTMLKRSSKHFESGNPLPDDLIDAKVKSKSAFSGRDSLRQLQFAQQSLAVFSKEFAQSAAEEGSHEGLDSTNVFNDITNSTLPGIVHNPDSHFQCSFGHLMGYGAGYYGYMWSKVFALDVFEAIRAKDGLLSPELGRRYTDCIIGRGGAKDPNLMLRDFLGRAPEQGAFLRNLGLKEEAL